MLSFGYNPDETLINLFRADPSAQSRGAGIGTRSVIIIFGCSRLICGLVRPRASSGGRSSLAEALWQRTPVVRTIIPASTNL